MSFYNSTNAIQPELNLFRQAAQSQETRILAFFKRNAGKMFTPSQINDLIPQAPIHSIRARITTLEKAGHLVKTTVQRQSRYGRPEHCWVYPRRQAA